MIKIYHLKAVIVNYTKTKLIKIIKKLYSCVLTSKIFFFNFLY